MDKNIACTDKYSKIIQDIQCGNDLKEVGNVLDSLMDLPGFGLHLSSIIDDCPRDVDLGVVFLMACTRARSLLVRDSSVVKLGSSYLSDERVDPVLADRVGDSSWIVRCSAMFSLASRRATRYTSKIIARYATWSPIEKQWVLMSLVKMSDVESSDFLWRIFKFSRNKERKCIAAAGLHMLGVNEVYPNIRSEYLKVNDFDLNMVVNLCDDLLKENSPRKGS